MSAKNNAANNDVFVYSRTFSAPRKLVFRAFTETDALAQWWGPNGFRVHVAKSDIRPGGCFHYRLDGPGGLVMWGMKVYREIISPEKITWVNSFSDENGGLGRHPLAPEWPQEMLNEITLTEKNGTTTVTLHSRAINCTEAERKMFNDNFASMEQGYSGTLEQLEAFIGSSEKDRTVQLSRTYKASKNLVWEAWTNPVHLARWWGPNGFKTITDSMDLRASGAWIYTMTGPDGTVFPNRVDYYEVLPMERLAYHHGTGNDSDPGQFDVVVTFEETAAGTTVTMRSVFESAEELAYLIKNYNVLEGGQQTLSRLDAILENMPV